MAKKSTVISPTIREKFLINLDKLGKEQQEFCAELTIPIHRISLYKLLLGRSARQHRAKLAINEIVKIAEMDL